jgi:hypothetical protein
MFGITEFQHASTHPAPATETKRPSRTYATSTPLRSLFVWRTRTTVLRSRIRTPEPGSSSRAYSALAVTTSSTVLPGIADGTSERTSSRAIEALPSGK